MLWRNPLELGPPNGYARTVGVGEVELMPGHAGALFQTTLEPAEKWDERRQLAETLEQRTSTEMDFDDDEIGALTLGDELLDAAD